MSSIYDERYRRVIARLKQARRDLDLTQEDVAKHLGVHRSWVGKVEQCERRLDLLETHLLGRLYGLSLSDLERDLKRVCSSGS